MDYKEFMLTGAPEDLRPQVFDTKGEIRKNAEKMAKEKGISVEEVMEHYYEEVLNKAGLSVLDMDVP